MPRILVMPEKSETESGTTAHCSFDNPDFLKAMNALFGISSEREKISQIEIDKEGITARIEWND